MGFMAKLLKRISELHERENNLQRQSIVVEVTSSTGSIGATAVQASIVDDRSCEANAKATRTVR